MAAGVASSPLRLHAFRPCFQASQSSPSSLTSSNLHLHPKFRRFPSVSCQINPDDNNNNNPTESCCENDASVQEGSVDGSTTEATASPSSSSDSAVPELPTRDVNRRVAVASVLGAVGLFLSGRLDFGISLKDLSAAALSYEEALSNGKPTVVEFYADWCEVCRELAPDVYKVEEQYRDRVNFVMLNVDNTKWEQELDEFGVEGIPHFAFLDREGNEEGNVVGRLPRQYFAENVEALVRGEASIPHARVVGQFSKPESRKVRRVVDPRSHG